MLGVVPVIRALREKSNDNQSETMDSIDRSYLILVIENVQSFQKHTKSIINQMLKINKTGQKN